MNEHELFQRSFSALHASDNTLQRVMRRVHNKKSMNGTPKRIAVLVAVLIVLLSLATATYATGLWTELVAILTPAENPAQVIDDAFGDNISTEKPNMEDAYGNPIEAPSMERPAVDLTETEKLIGAYISDVDGILTVGDNVFTLKQFLIDETGSGAITWTVENPNGIAYGDAGYGLVYFNSSPFDEPAIFHYGADGSKKKSANLSTALIAKDPDGTMLELVSYFGTVDKYQIGDSLIWRVSQNRKQEMKTIQITPVNHIPATTMTTAEGMRLTIASQNLTIDVDSNVDFITDKIVIHFKDGTQYCVEDDEKKIYNISGSYWRNSEAYRYDDVVFLFNRLIDTDKVSSVSVTAGFTRLEIVGDYYEPVRNSETFVFYP